MTLNARYVSKLRCPVVVTSAVVAFSNARLKSLSFLGKLPVYTCINSGRNKQLFVLLFE